MSNIYYYVSPSGDNPVANFLDSLTEKQQGKITRIFAHIKERGLGIYIPNVKKLTGTKFWEIKIVGKNSLRVIYAIIYKGDVLLLNGFIKKSQKTPIKEIKTSKTRLAEWINSNVLTK